MLRRAVARCYEASLGYTEPRGKLIQPGGFALANPVQSEIVGASALIVAAGAALVLAWRRGLRISSAGDVRRTARIFSVGLLLQIIHFLEEYSTGFYRQYPPVLGLAPWPPSFFLSINLVCLAIWVWALFSLKGGSRLALAPIWFFCLAALANGIGHPLLALYAGGYFPGLVSAPLVGIVGGWLLVRMLKTTVPRPDSTLWRQAGLFIETILFSVIVPGAVVFWIPQDLLHLWNRMLPERWTTWHSIAIVPLTLGLIVYLRCLWEFAARGNGIPAPVDHPKRLVVSGLYRYVRNPMYVGVLLFLLGEALFLTSWRVLVYTLAWLAFVHINVLLYEEPNLRRKFNGSYEHYRAVVRRWIPGKPYRNTADYRIESASEKIGR